MATSFSFANPSPNDWAAAHAAAAAAATVAPTWNPPADGGMCVDTPAGGACGNCNAPLKLNTVKNGANAGRNFFSCPNTQKDVKSACNTSFRWETVQPGDFVSTISQLHKCKKCQRALKSGRVNKEGPNKGQIFWTCPADCDGSFVWDSPNSIVKTPKVTKDDLDKLTTRLVTLENELFKQGEALRKLMAYTRCPL